MTDAGDVSPATVLAFWRQSGSERWYKRHDPFDAELRGKFLALWQRAAAGELSAWEATDDGALALVIVLDQFPRNMFRDEAKAYSSDPLALEVANRALARGADTRVEPALREFLYLPFMHSEHLKDQLRCVELFSNFGSPDNVRHAHNHADIVRRFGRFPHRNPVLGRAMTAEERAFLDGGGFSGG
jgi:uncharacterized protein (DUF924 family)